MFISCRKIATILILVLLSSAWALPVYAITDAPIDTATIEKNRKANAECYTCHSAAAIKQPPRAGLDLSKLKGSRLEPEIFTPSDHGGMDCRQCHSRGYVEYPHSITGKNETAPCAECHAAKVLRLAPQFSASVHAKEADFTCNTCHDAHVNIVQKRLKDPAKIVAQDNYGCLECHNSGHEWLPNAKLHLKTVRCIDCHTPAVAATDLLSHEILGKNKAEKKCVACHSANNSLKMRLYRHMVQEEQEKYGFINSVFLPTSYVIGATRHPLLDAIVVGLVILTLVGVLGHGVIRFICAIRRKEKSK